MCSHRYIVGIMNLLYLINTYMFIKHLTLKKNTNNKHEVVIYDGHYVVLPVLRGYTGCTFSRFFYCYYKKYCIPNLLSTSIGTCF